MQYKIGDRIYFDGNYTIAVSPQFGTIVDIEHTQWGTNYIIEYDDGTTDSVQNIKTTYSENGSTLYVTLDAYKQWAKEKFGNTYEQWAVLNLPCRDLENVTMPLETRQAIMFMLDDYGYQFDFDGEKFIITNHDMFTEIYATEENGKVYFWTKQILNEVEL